MDARELQRLKEAAQKADKDIIRSHGWKGTVMEFDALHADEQFLLAANPAAVLELVTLAERAVSPAESVQKHAMKDLWRLLSEYMRAHREGPAERLTEAAITLDKWLIDKLTAAHAEGRRSAMEELAKEKERADRAEYALGKAIYAARQAPDLGHLPCYKLSDGLLIPVGIVKTIIDRGDMMLSLLDVRTALLAQPLQQPSE